MKPIHEPSDVRVKFLRDRIKRDGEQLERIMAECPHDEVRHSLFPDIYGNQGTITDCVICGKSLGLASIPVMDRDKIETSTHVERKNP